jgi:uncharacterized DUF497 family protein
MRLHHEFEWDPTKSAANKTKHGITFDDAQRVLEDENGSQRHVEFTDHEHSTDELRYITFGPDPVVIGLLLVISWTSRGENVTRIISARRVNRKERAIYDKEIGAN